MKMSGRKYWRFARVKNSINYHPEFGCLCQVKFSTTWKSARSIARRILKTSDRENVDSLWTNGIPNCHKSSESSLVNFRWNSFNRFNHSTAIVVARMMTLAVTGWIIHVPAKKNFLIEAIDSNVTRQPWQTVTFLNWTSLNDKVTLK